MAGTGQGFQNIKWLEIKKSQAILKRFMEWGGGVVLRTNQEN